MTDLKGVDAKTALKSNIKAIRERLGLNQTQLADRMGVSQKAISDIENGKAWPDYKTVQSLSKALDTDEADLFTNPGMKSALDYYMNKK